MADTWQSCLQRLKTSSIDERMIPSLVNVLDLDNVASFSLAKSSLNAVSFPRKLRKQFMERFDKVVKHRRRVQEKSTSSRHRYHSGTTLSAHPQGHSFLDATSSRTPASSSQRRGADVRSASQYASSKRSSMATPLAEDDRRVYDGECATAFVTGLHDFYDRLTTLSAERAKKMQGKKKHSKRQEIKSWFSSTHEFDAYVDKFLDTAIYKQHQSRGTMVEAVTVTRTGGGVLSRSNSNLSNATAPPSTRPPASTSTASGGVSSSSNAYHTVFSTTSLTRSFGSRSSTSSSFNGAPSSAHQL